MHRFLILIALISITGVSAAVAEVEQHQIEYFWDVTQGNEPVPLQFPQFDTQHGNRELISITLTLDGQYDLTMYAENLESYPIYANDWFVDSGLMMMFDFTELPMGPIWGGHVGLYTCDLGANDGIPGQGSDYTEWGYFEQVVSARVDIHPEDIPIFRGEGLLDAELYPWLDLAISAPPPFFDLDIISHIHVGMVTISYEWQYSKAAILMVDPLPIIAGEPTTVTAMDMYPNTLTYLAMSASGPGNTWIGPLDITLGLNNPTQLLTAVMSDDFGVATWESVAPTRFIGRTIWLQAAQDGLTTGVVEAPIE